MFDAAAELDRLDRRIAELTPPAPCDMDRRIDNIVRGVEQIYARSEARYNSHENR